MQKSLVTQESKALGNVEYTFIAIDTSSTLW